MSIPSFLVNDADTFARDPRQACKDWLRDAKFGLFIHYGLYSLIGRHEWVQLRESIRVAEYAALRDWFIADRFDANAIAALAVEAGMKYITITTRHHDSFCLWDTKQTTFKSTLSPCGRDLIAELADACNRHQLGLCLYYSHGRDWKHPHAPSNDQYGGHARPAYNPPEPTYATGEAHDLQIYVDFMTAQITELLTQYGPIASIWLDGIAVPKAGDADAFQCQALYDHIHRLQPQVLVSYKQGLTGTEDYFAPEEQWKFDPTAHDKLTEICGHLTGGWGYTAGTPVRDADEIMALLQKCWSVNSNLLLNTGPSPDGSIAEGEQAVLREIGRRLRT